MAHHAGRSQHRLREFLTAAFMAASLMVLHHSVPLIDVLDRFAFLFAASNSMQVTPAEPKAVVIGIDQNTFEQDFFEQSPLNRCAMAEKLRAIYAAHPAQLIIDFDLSPSLAGVLAGTADASREKACESQLYAVLQTHAMASRTILLAPAPVSNAAAQAAKQSWRSALSAQGVLFGDGMLPVQFGFVQQQYAHTGTLAAVANSGAGGVAAHDQKGSVTLHPVQRATDDTASRIVAANEGTHTALTPLNFRAYGRDVRSLSWSEWRSAAPALALEGKTVFFGAAYGSDDRFLTPIDDLYGVDLHAAAFVSLRNPISVTSAGASMLLDIVIGMIFGATVAIFWNRYLAARVQQDDAHQGRRAFAFLWLWGLVALYLVLLWVLMYAATYLVATFNIWTSPLPMALGMGIDAFIMGAIHAIEHAPNSASMPHVQGSSSPARLSARTAPAPVRAAELLKMTTWTLVVVYALYLIAHH